jgi:hypothetical protein
MDIINQEKFWTCDGPTQNKATNQNACIFNQSTDSRLYFFHFRKIYVKNSYNDNINVKVQDHHLICISNSYIFKLYLV